MEHIWNLNHLYHNFDEWNKDLERLNSLIEGLKDRDILKDYETLTGFFRELSDCYQLVERVYVYPKRILDLQNDNVEAKEKFSLAIDAYNNYLKVQNTYVKVMIEKKAKVFELIKEDDYWYRYVNLLMNDEHIAEADVLEKYNKTIPKVKNSYQTLLNDEVKFENVLIDGEDVELTRKNYSQLLENENQDIRHQVFSNYMEGYKNILDQAFRLYREKLEAEIELYKSEGYETLMEKKTKELEISEDTLTNLIKGVNKHLDVMHNFVALKKEISGLDDFYTYDGIAARHVENKRKIEFEEAIEMIKEAFKPLGEEYLSLIDKCVEEGWVDVYPREHKRINPSTSISYNGVPYILLNYARTLNGVRTFGHEVAHALHTYYSKTANKMEYFEFNLFLTEIVSKVNELLINEYFRNTAKSDEEKKEVLFNVIGSLGLSIFDETMQTEFEYQAISRLEQGMDIDADYLCRSYEELMKKYNGEHLSIDELNKYGWLLVTHFVWQDSYYMFQYAIGAAIGTSIALKILADENYAKKYLELLSVGNRVSIEDALKIVDIDIHNQNYLDDALNYLKDSIEELKTLVLK